VNTLIEKIKAIYIPFLLIFIGFLSLYTFLHWFLVIDKGLINMKQDTLNYWLPIILPCFPIYIWLRPRIHLLIFKDDYYSFYQFSALAAICITTIITQEYLVAATGKLSELDSITQISQKEKTKYYIIKKYYFDKATTERYVTGEVSGKHNEDLNFYNYFAMPIVTDTSYPANLTCSAWLGVKKTKRISNRIDDSIKESAYNEFNKKCEDDFNEENFSKYVYLERLANSTDLDNYKEAIKTSSRHNGQEPIVLKAINEPFEARLGDRFKWIFFSFGIGNLIWLIFLFFPSINISKLRTYQKIGRLPSEKSDLAEILELMIPRSDFFVTPIIANINILIYLVMTICGYGFMSFKGKDLLTWGANYRPLVLEGDWWRLLTSTFLHGGIMHILANMYGLVFVGLFLEPVLGRTRYFIVYILTGILASISSIWWYKATVSVGASGAIFGLYGVFLSLLLTNIFPREMKGGFLLSTSVFIGFNLIMGFTGGIDNAAHIGGLISGLIIGFLLYPFLNKQSRY
jgi:rhomboid protease GluP